MIWFTHVKGPLGTYVRITYTAILDIGFRNDLEKLAEIIKESTGYRTDILCRSSIDDLYTVSLTDPDAIDILNSVENENHDLCVLIVSAQ